jgi:hypothetical protein
MKEKINTTTTTTTEDPQIQIDRNLIEKLKRVTKPIYSEMEEIFYLYKKYVDENAAGYCATCNAGPSNSIQRYYWKVIALSI